LSTRISPFKGEGVFGSGAIGVHAECTGDFVVGDNAAIQAHSPGLLPAVVGTSEQGIGVWGKGNTGVEGVGAAIGVNGQFGGAMGYLGCRDPVFDQLAGVFGTSEQLGVMGLTTNDSGTGVYGGGARKAGDPGAGGIGVRGESFTGVGVKGQSFGSGVGVYGESSASNGVLGLSHHPFNAAVSAVNDAGGFALWAEAKGGHGIAAHFQGDVEVTGNFRGGVRVNGDVELHGSLNIKDGGDVILADCAEDFDIADAVCDATPGSVMVLDDTGAIRPSNEPYDKCVVGVLSGAGPFRPAIVLDRTESTAKRKPIALIGKVCCKVDAQYGTIEVGDLLTTSLTPGHAMKAVDPHKAFGAVIGKALRPLKEGAGLVPILIALQ
jgi:hypothetical protein